LDDRKCLIIAAPTIADDKVITNDLVELMSVKTFKWLGRYDAVINSGGIKLIPEQIEEKLSALISNRFFVAGLPDSVLGEKLILVIENKTKNISKENLLKKIKDLKHISKFEIPKEIYLLQRFFETPTKKINRTKTLQLINT
jgi:O-succinylbenzoic acid--CoA ligase